MFRSKLMRTLGMLAAGLAYFAATGPNAFAGLFGRHSSYCYSYPSVEDTGNNQDGPDGNGVPDPAIVRQVRVIYFSTEYNAWFEVDAVVPPAGASIGLSTIATVPSVGAVRGWVVSVYRQPRMTSPYKTEINNAATQEEAAGAAGTTGTSLQISTSAGNSAVVRTVPAEVKSLIGASRLWTNKERTRQAIAELLEIRRDTIVVRNLAGIVYEQAINSLSEADVAFLRSSSLLASANR